MFFLVGPTAVGKTNIAVEVATQIGAEIVGADAFQVYAGLDLLTAKPAAEWRTRVPHHLIGEIPLSQSFDVAQFLALARARIAEITARGKRVLVVGGTGLYVRALTHGLADLPPANPALRAELDELPLEILQQRLAALDPESANFIDRQNKRRLIRAIEVSETTGQPFSSFRENWAKPLAEIHGVLLTRDRADLYARIDARTVQMFKQGVLDEVSTAQNVGPSAEQVIGFREAQACVRGEISPAEAIARIQQSTRRYAKRQLTWFRREPELAEVNLTALAPEIVVRQLSEAAAKTR